MVSLQSASNKDQFAGRLSALQAEPIADVLIIGGGINGLSTFRDLALQGIKVVLVERNDYCSGASAASSHMVHGGVRYLENGEIRLVKESLQERNRLLALAPHYVKPLKTTIPIYSMFSGLLSAPMRLFLHKQGKPKERGALLIKVGLLIYDTFGRNGGRLPRHVFLGKQKSQQVFPKLNKKVKFTATYYDAAMESPERLALDVLKDALKAGPHARAANYLDVIAREGNSVKLRDVVSGEEFWFTTKVIVNTSGPWVDVTNKSLGESTNYMGGTKGSHIVIDNSELFNACDNREIFFENKDGRIVLMYPILGKVLVGTTDLEHDISEPAVCTEDEVDYFFDLIKFVFPEISVTRNQIVFKYSGVRPLPASQDLAPGFVSRDYKILKTADSTPILSLVGGKWTTFRALGEHMSSEVLKILGLPRKVVTSEIGIGGGSGYPNDFASRRKWVDDHSIGVSKERAEQLLSRYGTFAVEVIDFVAKFGDVSLKSLPDFSAGELIFLIQNEYVVHLDDLLSRRTFLNFIGAVTPEVEAEVKDIFDQALISRETCY